MTELNFNSISANEIDKVMTIVAHAKSILKKNGSLQWQQGYPNKETFINDIRNKALFGLYENGSLVGFGAFIFGKDLNYVSINGQWSIPANEKDMAIHRVAVSEGSHGKEYGRRILEYGIQYAKKNGCLSVKVDTHEKNVAMQKSIERAGFSYKGIVNKNIA